MKSQDRSWLRIEEGFMRFVVLVLFLFSSLAEAKSYDLAVQAMCNGKWEQANGVFVCNQKVLQQARIKLKIPPTRGQIRVVDCNKDLTADGNPDDFNTQIWRTGWWIFAKSVIVPSETPEIILPTTYPSSNDCAIVASVIGIDSGAHDAVFLYQSDTSLVDIFDYSCAGDAYLKTVNGMGKCRALEGASLTIKITPPSDAGVLNIVGDLCGIKYKIPYQTNNEIIQTIQIPRDVCPLDVQIVTKDKDLRSRFILVGKDRKKIAIDNPLMIQDGGKKRVFLPTNATVMSSEIYYQDKVTWRSGPRKEDSYEIGNADGIVCHSAWSLASFSGSCWDFKTNQEVPYYFK
jgi:hypothetical protein